MVTKSSTVAGTAVYPKISKSTSSVANVKQYRVERFIATWWLECVAIYLSIGSLVALAITLSQYRSEPVPKWSFGLTLNAVISIYSGLFKSTLLFVVASALAQYKWQSFHQWTPLRYLDYYDDACRGPLGAVQVMFVSRLNTLRSLPPFLAALVIVLGIVIDPFLQQVLKYYSCQRPSSSGTACVYVVNKYAETYETGHISFAHPHVSSTTPPGMQSAINAALAGGLNITSNTPPFVCEGNSSCTVDPYWTVAFCASCQDFTESLRVHRTGAPSSLHHSTNTTWLGDGQYPTRTYRPGTYFQMGADPMDDDEHTIAAFAFIVNTMKENHPPAAYPFSPSWTTQSPRLGAARCSLKPCAQKLEPVGMSNQGTIQERIIRSVPIRSCYQEQLGLYTCSAIPSQCLKDNKLDLVRFDTSNEKYPFCRGASQNSHVKRICDQCSFAMHSMPITALQFGFGQDDDQRGLGSFGNFDATYWSVFDDLRGTFVHKQTKHEDSVTEEMGPIFWRNGGLSFESLNATFHNVARAMSVQMRRDVKDTDQLRKSSLSSHGSYVCGIAIDSETCVDVVWAWLSLPAVLLICGLLVFAAVAIDTFGSATDMWKASSLPLLFHGLEGNSLSEYSGAENDIYDMEDAASALKVRLEATGDGKIVLRKRGQAERC